MWAIICAAMLLLMPLPAIADSFVLERGFWVQRVVGTQGIGSFFVGGPGFIGEGSGTASVASLFFAGPMRSIPWGAFTYTVQQEGPFQGGQLGGIGIFQVRGEPVFVDIIVDPATKNFYSFTLSGSGIVPPTPTSPTQVLSTRIFRGSCTRKNPRGPS